MDEIDKQPQNAPLSENQPQVEKPREVQRQTPATPKKKSSLLPILLTVLLLLTGGVAIYFGYQNYMLKNQKIITPPPPEPPIKPTEIPDPTANWKSYTNPVDNFSFKYPPTWTIDIKGEMGDERKENIIIGLTKEQAKISIYANMVGIGGLGQDYEGTVIVLDGNNLFLYRKTNTFDKTQLLGITDTLTQSLGVFKIGEKTYSIMLAYPLSYSQTEAGNLEKEFIQILSTFQFIDQTTDTANWKTYTNTKYWYGFQYPSRLVLNESDRGGSIQTESNNKISFYDTNDSSSTITDYLVKADKISQTAYEGLPSMQVRSTKKTVINGLNCIQRQEYLTAADITQINTYFKKGSVVVSIALIPTPGNSLAEDESIYNQILSTFKFADTKTITLQMNPINNTGESGTATLTDTGNNQTKVVLNIVNIAGNPPANIYQGSCSSPGVVKYKLAEVKNGLKTNIAPGISSTILNVSLLEIKSQLPLAIAVRYAASFTDPFLASCADIK